MSQNVTHRNLNNTCQRSTTVVQFTCNEQVAGSNPVAGFGE